MFIEQERRAEHHRPLGWKPGPTGVRTRAVLRPEPQAGGGWAAQGQPEPPPLEEGDAPGESTAKAASNRGLQTTGLRAGPGLPDPGLPYQDRLSRQQNKPVAASSIGNSSVAERAREEP